MYRDRDFSVEFMKPAPKPRGESQLLALPVTDGDEPSHPQTRLVIEYVGEPGKIDRQCPHVGKTLGGGYVREDVGPSFKGKHPDERLPETRFSNHNLCFGASTGDGSPVMV